MLAVVSFVLQTEDRGSAVLALSLRGPKYTVNLGIREAMFRGIHARVQSVGYRPCTWDTQDIHPKLLPSVNERCKGY